MLLIPTKIGPSPIHGTGLFATEPVLKGTPVWKFVPGFDAEFPPEFPDPLPPPARRQFLNYAYLSKATGKYVLCADDMRFINHSTSPNVVSTHPADGEGGTEGLDVAGRDIMAGEELSYDYRVFDEAPPS